MARQQVERLKQEFGLRLYSSFECEFQLLDGATLEPSHQSIDLFSHLKMSEYENFLCRMESQLYKAGVDCESFHLAYSPGQFEFATVPSYGVEAFDQFFRLKNGVKEVSQLEGSVATFMTKPFFSAGCANAGHYNHSLWDDDGTNAFYDARDPDLMSSIFQHWLAGILKHSTALTALCSPTTNCYRRLHQPWVPHQANWGVDNRLTAHRIKNI